MRCPELIAEQLQGGEMVCKGLTVGAPAVGGGCNALQIPEQALSHL